MHFCTSSNKRSYVNTTPFFFGGGGEGGRTTSCCRHCLCKGSCTRTPKPCLKGEKAKMEEKKTILQYERKAHPCTERMPHDEKGLGLKLECKMNYRITVNMCTSISNIQTPPPPVRIVTEYPTFRSSSKFLVL